MLERVFELMQQDVLDKAAQHSERSAALLREGKKEEAEADLSEVSKGIENARLIDNLRLGIVTKLREAGIEQPPVELLQGLFSRPSEETSSQIQPASTSVDEQPLHQEETREDEGFVLQLSVVPTEKALMLGTNKIPLVEVEWQLADYLHARANQWCETKDLVGTVGDKTSFLRALTGLRGKLGEAVENPTYIHSSGKGRAGGKYMLTLGGERKAEGAESQKDKGVGTSNGNKNETSQIYDMYCVKCRAHYEVSNVERVTFKNGREAVRAKCEVCETNMTRLVKLQDGAKNSSQAGQQEVRTRAPRRNTRGRRSISSEQTRRADLSREASPEESYQLNSAELYGLAQRLVSVDEETLTKMGVRIPDEVAEDVKAIITRSESTPEIIDQGSQAEDTLRVKLSGFVKNRQKWFVENVDNDDALYLLAMLAPVESEEQLAYLFEAETEKKDN